MATILVVDDDRVNQRMLEYTLKRQSHRVLLAHHGGEALELLAAERVDLIIADLSMPVVDGIELLEKVRADTTLAGLPFVMLTGSGLDRDHILARRAGADDILTKPTRLTEVSAVVEKLLLQPEGDEKG